MSVPYRAVGAQGMVLGDANAPAGFDGTGVANVALVQCFPLSAVLAALMRNKVDYFSLDVEGRELDILKTIPFDQIDITVREEG